MTDGGLCPYRDLELIVAGILVGRYPDFPFEYL